MSHAFATWEELDSSTDVAGVTWPDLQVRCTPGAGPAQTMGGWISDGTPIKEVLRQDWETVRGFGTTHKELVAHLDFIWAQAQPCDYDNPASAIDYDVRALPNNTLETSGPVHLMLSCLHTRGVQQDLLDPYNFNEGWNTEWILNDSRDELRVGGRNSSIGLLEYIRLFGFYEGGNDNEYRLDPTRLVQLLTNSKSIRDLDLRLDANSSSGGGDGGMQLPPLILILVGTVAIALLAWVGWWAMGGTSSGKKRNRKVSTRASSIGIGGSTEGRPKPGDGEEADAGLLLATSRSSAASSSHASAPRSARVSVAGSAADEWARLMNPRISQNMSLSQTMTSTRMLSPPTSPLALGGSPVRTFWRAPLPQASGMPQPAWGSAGLVAFPVSPPAADAGVNRSYATPSRMVIQLQPDLRHAKPQAMQYSYMLAPAVYSYAPGELRAQLQQER